jgi:hypothetical protein
MFTQLFKQLILPISALISLKNNNIWKISKIGWGKNNYQLISDPNTTTSDNILKVFYPKNSYSPSKDPQGGLGFYASPSNIFPAQDISITYQVRFDSSFNPMLGGKLPGLFISQGTDKQYMNDASGGKHNEYASSIRICWKKNFSSEAYLYIPKNQSSQYLSIPNLSHNPIYGNSLWRNTFQLHPSLWNNISIHLKLNTFDKSNTPIPDGQLIVTINDIQQNFDNLIWRIDNSVSITAFLFSTFFGGSTSKYATPNDTWTYFKNITLIKFK